MFPRGSRADRLLNTTGWRRVRAHWIAQALPCQAPRCHLPGVPIAYSGPYFTVVNGHRTINGAAFHCGHIVSRREAKRMGWTEDRINALANTRPEHALCSTRAGAREGNRAQRQAGRYPTHLPPAKPRLDTSRDW